MASIAGALRRIKQNPLAAVDRDRIESICCQCGHRWRERELDPATTIELFMQQVMAGNCPCSEVRHLSDRSFTAQAYCDARARLPLTIYQTLFHGVYQRVVKHTRQDQHLWHGHRTFHIDGSTFSMADTPEPNGIGDIHLLVQRENAGIVMTSSGSSRSSMHGECSFRAE